MFKQQTLRAATTIVCSVLFSAAFSQNANITVGASDLTKDTVKANVFMKGGTPMVSSQWTTIGGGSHIYLSSGNVGIGTGTTIPTQALQVVGTIYSTTGGFKFPDGTTQTAAANQWTSNVAGHILSTGNGNVGIGTGTVTPTEKLQVQGNGKISGELFCPKIAPWPGDSEIHLGDSSIVVTNYNQIYSTSYNNYKGIALGWSGAKAYRGIAIGTSLYVPTGADKAIVIGSGTGSGSTPTLNNSIGNSLMIGFNSNLPTVVVTQASGTGTRGKVFICTDPNSLIGNPTTYELNVGGTILSKEWIVKTGWCDFKFEPTYQRMTWKEKEDYIAKYKHLPEIAPGSEIETEGLKAGETMRGFVWNIEDNTLDIIDLQKENEELKKEVAGLKKQMQEIISQRK